MEMQLNRTLISRSSAVLALAVATAGIPAYVKASAPNTVTHHMSSADWRMLRETAAWTKLQSKLIRWKHLPDDWDGSDGVAPSCATADRCANFLMELEHQAAPVPEGIVAGDGEISYEWAKGEAFASASFTQDGAILLFLRETKDTPPFRLELERFDVEAMEPFFQRIGAFA